MSRRLCAGLLALLASTVGVVSTAGHAATCMSRTTTQTDAPNFEFVVPVPDAKASDFTQRGFKAAPCKGLALNLAKHKAMVCDLALGNEAVQKRTEQVLGIDAVKMCAVAKVLLPDSPTVTDQPNAVPQPGATPGN